MSPEPRRVGPTVAVAGGKGGTGKTTTTLALGRALGAQMARPLVVDADAEIPDLHIRAGVELEPGLPAVDAGRPPSHVARRSSTVPGVDVIPAGATRDVPEGALRRLAATDRPVIVDCPAGAGPDAAAPIRVADACVLVTTTSAASRLDAVKTARMADALGAPPRATVRRAVTDQGAEPGSLVAGPARSSSRGHHYLARPVIDVPFVTGRPLDSDRVLDRFAVLAERLFETGSCSRASSKKV